MPVMGFEKVRVYALTHESRSVIESHERLVSRRVWCVRRKKYVRRSQHGVDIEMLGTASGESAPLCAIGGWSFIALAAQRPKVGEIANNRSD